MRTIRNLAFLALAVTYAWAGPRPVAAADCDWNGICEGEEWTIYYMCGDCGNTYCTNFCETHDQYWMADQCYYSYGWDFVQGGCDSMGSTQGCDAWWECTPPI